jgi:DNA-binding MarR family transcriptional regulator
VPADNGTAVQLVNRTIFELAALSRALRSAACAIEKNIQRAAGSSELTLLHWQILVHLAYGETNKQLDLARATGIPSAHLTKLLDDLEAMRMVCRQRSSEDRRQMRLTLTESGRKAVLGLSTALDHKPRQCGMAELKSSLDRFVLRASHS